MGILWDWTGINCYSMWWDRQIYVSRTILQKHQWHAIKMLHNTFPPRSHSALIPLTVMLMQDVTTIMMQQVMTGRKVSESVLASRAWPSAHIWEKHICLKIQQPQRNAKWFQSLLLPPSGSFNSKKFQRFFERQWAARNGLNR